MNCTYEFQGKIYTENQFKALLKKPGIQNQIEALLQEEEESFSPYSTDDDFSEESEEDTGDFKPQYEKMNRYKRSLIDLYKNRISSLTPVIKQLEKKGEKDKANKYELLKIDLEKRIRELTSEIRKFNDKNPMSLTEFRYQAMVDMERVSDLLNAGKIGTDPFLNKEIFENAEEAKRIINFYKAMEFVKTNKTIDNISINEHPFFTKEEIYDEDGLPTLIPKEIRDILNDVADDFKYYEQQLDETYKSVITQVVNSNPNIQRVYKKNLTYEQIMEARKDIPWIDAMFFDMAKGGITGDNGVMTQIAMSLFTKTWDEQISNYKNFEQKHDALLPKVRKALLGLKKSLNVLGLKEPSFDIFFQKQNDKNTGKLAQKYSADYIEANEAIQQIYESKVEYAMSEPDLVKRDRMLFKAFENQQNWLRENTMLFDIRKIPEIAQQFPEFADYFMADDGHVEELKNTIGEKGYQKELEAQIEKLKQFSKWKDNTTMSILMSLGVDSVNNLNENQLDMLEYEIMKSNPFHAISTIYNTSPAKFKGLLVNPDYKYNSYIPRRNKIQINRKESFETGKYVFVNTNESTNFYDKNFEVIENNPDLLEYHELISNELQEIFDSFPEDVKKKLFSNSLISTRKTISEIFADPKLSIISKILKSIQYFWDGLKSGFGINLRSSTLYDNVDVITNKLDPKVNADFINSNEEKINNRLTVELYRFSNLNKVPGVDKVKKYYPNSFVDYYSMSPQALNYLATMLDLKNPIELKNKFGNSIPIGKLLKNAVTSEIVESQSVNLPKIIKYYSKMAHEYSARQEMLPFMKVMKEHYEQIQDVKIKRDSVLTLNGQKYTDGSVRRVANSQFQEWFDRAALGHYGDDGFWGGYDIVLNRGADNEKRKTFIDKILAIVTGKILTSEEQKMKKEINKLIDNAGKNDDVTKLVEIRESLGKNPALSAVFSSFLSYLRILRMGYNVNSAITNFIEGQTANMIIASSGDYFDSKHFYRAYNIIQGSVLKSALGGYARGMTKGAFKARTLVDRYDILQDSTNELQKAGVKTPLDRFSKFTPMEANKRTEYLNQVPLMIAVMLDTQIKGKNNETSSVWDAMDAEGKLKPNFRTEENVETWENGKGQGYADFKSKVNNAIVMAHGNYAELRGMMVKKNLLGKAFVFLKTWLGSQLYQRFATERDDVETGIKGWKGRYWSHTKLSGGIHGGLVAATLFGVGTLPLTLGVGVGVGIGVMWGSKTGVRTNLDFLQELTFTLKAIARKMVGLPINIISAMTIGKQVISEPGYEKLITDGEGKLGKFTERDAKNMKAVVSDISVTLSWLLLTLLIKNMLWDDDDEKDSGKRKMHNFLTNKTLQLLESSTMYVNMIGMGEQIANNAIFSYIGDLGTYMGDLNKYWKGEMTPVKHAEKLGKFIFPSMIRDSSFGFTKLMERPYSQTPFDYMFEDAEKIERRKVQALRDAYKLELQEETLPDGSPKYSDKQIRKLVDKKHKLPKDIKDTKSRTATESEKEEVDEDLKTRQREEYRRELEAINEEQELRENIEEESD